MGMIAASVQRLRLVGVLEGISFLILVFVAMPLKYIWEMEMAVKIFGWAHGILFMAYCSVLYMAHLDREWKISKTFLLFVAALVPFGPFIADSKLKKETV